MRRVETETEKIVAVRHEVVEDRRPPQRWRGDELRREGFSEPVLAALEGVTRREGETCEEFTRSFPKWGFGNASHAGKLCFAVRGWRRNGALLSPPITQ